jgi:hypothetical protein
VEDLWNNSFIIHKEADSDPWGKTPNIQMGENQIQDLLSTFGSFALGAREMERKRQN